MKGWLKAKPASKYAGVSERTLRTWLKEGLRYSKVRGSILIKVTWLDEYIEKFEETSNDVDRIVTEVLAGI